MRVSARYWLDLCIVQAKMSMLSYMQYRVSIVLYVLARLVEPLIYLWIWTTITQENTVSNYDQGAFAAYFIVLMIVREQTTAGAMLKYEMRIRRGTLSDFLQRPVSLVLWDAVDNLAMRLVTGLIVVLAATLLALLFRPQFETSLWSIALFPAALAMAWLVSFVIDYALGMLVFWTHSISALRSILALAMILFVGRLAPLDVLPSLFQTIANLLPFRWILAFPTELAIGKLTVQDTLTGFVMQVIWISAGFVGLHYLWNAGIQRYSAVGG